MVFGNLSTGYWLGAAGGGADTNPHWQEIGRTTLGSAGDSIDVTGLETKPYLMTITHVLDDTTGNPTLVQRLNSSNATDYVQRYSADFGTDSTNTNIDGIYGTDGIGAGTEAFGVSHINNASGQEKLILGTFTADRAGTGAGYAPNSWEVSGKRAVTDNITACSIDNNNDGNFNTGSEVVVLGYDPADTSGTNFWQELADVTLSGAGDTLSSGTFTAKKYLMYQVYIVTSGNTRTTFTFNSDTGANYSHIDQENGGASSTKTSRNNIEAGGGDNDHTAFHTGYIINTAAQAKLMINHNMKTGGAGNTNAPTRKENVAKWANTTNQITSIQAVNDQGGDYNTGSRIKVWGSD